MMPPQGRFDRPYLIVATAARRAPLFMAGWPTLTARLMHVSERYRRSPR